MSSVVSVESLRQEYRGAVDKALFYKSEVGSVENLRQEYRNAEERVILYKSGEVAAQKAEDDAAVKHAKEREQASESVEEAKREIQAMRDNEQRMRSFVESEAASLVESEAAGTTEELLGLLRKSFETEKRTERKVEDAMCSRMLLETERNEALMQVEDATCSRMHFEMERDTAFVEVQGLKDSLENERHKRMLLEAETNGTLEELRSALKQHLLRDFHRVDAAVVSTEEVRIMQRQLDEERAQTTLLQDQLSAAVAKELSHLQDIGDQQVAFQAERHSLRQKVSATEAALRDARSTEAAAIQRAKQGLMASRYELEAERRRVTGMRDELSVAMDELLRQRERVFRYSVAPALLSLEGPRSPSSPSGPDAGEQTRLVEMCGAELHAEMASLVKAGAKLRASQARTSALQDEARVSNEYCRKVEQQLAAAESHMCACDEQRRMAVMAEARASASASFLQTENRRLLAGVNYPAASAAGCIVNHLDQMVTVSELRSELGAAVESEAEMLSGTLQAEIDVVRRAKSDAFALERDLRVVELREEASTDHAVRAKNTMDADYGTLQTVLKYQAADLVRITHSESVLYDKLAGLEDWQQRLGASVADKDAALAAHGAGNKALREECGMLESELFLQKRRVFSLQAELSAQRLDDLSASGGGSPVSFHGDATEPQLPSWQRKVICNVDRMLAEAADTQTPRSTRHQERRMRQAHY